MLLNITLKKYKKQTTQNLTKMNFKDLTKAVAKSYLECLPYEYLEENRYTLGETIKPIRESKTLDELINVLDGLGFSPIEAYSFAFESILEDFPYTKD